MGYIVIIALTVVFLVAFLKRNLLDVISPVGLLLCGLGISALFALVGRFFWNPFDLSGTCIAILISGIVSFCMGSLLADKISPKKKRRKSNFSWIGAISNKMRDAVRSSTIRRIVLAAVFLLLAFSVWLRIHETLEIAKNLGLEASDYFTAAEFVRGQTAAFTDVENVQFGTGFSTICRQLEKFVTAAAYASVVMLAYGLSLKRNVRWKIVIPSLMLVLCCLYIIITNSRAALLFYAIAFIVTYLICIMRSGRRLRKPSPKTIGIISVIVIGSAVAFFAFGLLFGRSVGANPLEYVTQYFGSGIPSLEALLESGYTSMYHYGANTFNTFLAFFTKFGIIDNVPSYSLSWVDVGGLYTNIFTCFARFYFDFGFAGVIVLSVLTGLILTFGYRRVLQSTSLIPTAVYCYIAPNIFDMAREEYLFSRFFSVYNALVVAAIAVLVAIFSSLLYSNKDFSVERPDNCQASSSITFVVPGVNVRPGGGMRIIFEYANRLALRGHHVEIVHLGDFTLRDVGLPRATKRLIVWILYLRGIKWFKFSAPIGRMLAYTKGRQMIEDADFVVATAAVTAEYVKDLPISCGRKLYLIQDYENWDMTTGELHDTYRYGMRNIAISHWLAEIVQDVSGQCDCIPNPIDTDIFYPEIGVERERLSIAVMYSSKPHKGFDDAWAALKRVHEHQPQMRVYAFGVEFRPRDFPAWVTYVENANDAELRKIYSRCSMYVCASRGEGFALTCVEAMACGCSLVVTDFAGSREYAVDGVNSVVVKAGDLDSIADGILRVMNDDALREKLSHQGVIDARKRTWCSAVDQFESIMREADRKQWR